MDYFRRAGADRGTARTSADNAGASSGPSRPQVPTSGPSERSHFGLAGLSLRQPRAEAPVAPPALPWLPDEVWQELPLGSQEFSALSATGSRFNDLFEDDRLAMKIVQYGIPRITPALEHFDAVVTHIRKLGRQAQFEPWGALATRLAQVIDERLRNDTNPAHTAELYVSYAIAIGHLPNEYQVDPWCSLARAAFGRDRLDTFAPYFAQAVLSQRSRLGRIRMAVYLPRRLEHIQDWQLRSRAFDCCLDVASDVMGPRFTVEIDDFTRELFVIGLASEISIRPEENRQFDFDRVADAHDRLPMTTVTEPLKHLARAIPSLPSFIERPHAFRRITDTVALHWERVGVANLVVSLLEELSRVIPMLPRYSQNAAVDQIIEIVDRLPADWRDWVLQELGL